MLDEQMAIIKADAEMEMVRPKNREQRRAATGRDNRGAPRFKQTRGAFRKTVASPASPHCPTCMASLVQIPSGMCPACTTPLFWNKVIGSYQRIPQRFRPYTKAVV